jgi:hypothetical protein
VTSGQFFQYCQETRILLDPETVKTIYPLVVREPLAFDGGDVNEDGSWRLFLSRRILDYEGVTSLDEYLERVERLTVDPPEPARRATPSPLGVVASLDFVNAVWRGETGGRLFTFPSAERAAKLSQPVATIEELDSTLTALGEILRTSTAGARAASPDRRLRAPSHEEPLAPLSDYVQHRVGEPGAAWVAQSVDVLQRSIAVRDAAQHTEANARGVAALDALGVGHPIVDPAAAWARISLAVVDALTILREQLAAAEA